MWKKSEGEVSSPTPMRKAPAPRPESSPRKSRIGAGLLLKGELYGEEDVIIEGKLEGKITLKNHGVIVEESGQVDADISANSIRVAGQVRGNLNGTGQVVLLETARVEGNIKAKSVTLEMGAQFRGSIDMETVGAVKGGSPYADRPTKESRESIPKPTNSAHVSSLA